MWCYLECWTVHEIFQTWVHVIILRKWVMIKKFRIFEMMRIEHILKEDWMQFMIGESTFYVPLYQFSYICLNLSDWLFIFMIQITIIYREFHCIFPYPMFNMIELYLNRLTHLNKIAKVSSFHRIVPIKEDREEDRTWLKSIDSHSLFKWSDICYLEKE